MNPGWTPHPGGGPVAVWYGPGPNLDAPTSLIRDDQIYVPVYEHFEGARMVPLTELLANTGPVLTDDDDDIFVMQQHRNSYTHAITSQTDR